MSQAFKLASTRPGSKRDGDLENVVDAPAISQLDKQTRDGDYVKHQKIYAGSIGMAVVVGAVALTASPSSASTKPAAPNVASVPRAVSATVLDLSRIPAPAGLPYAGSDSQSVPLGDGAANFTTWRWRAAQPSTAEIYVVQESVPSAGDLDESAGSSTDFQTATVGSHTTWLVDGHQLRWRSSATTSISVGFSGTASLAGARAIAAELPASVLPVGNADLRTSIAIPSGKSAAADTASASPAALPGQGSTDTNMWGNGAVNDDWSHNVTICSNCATNKGNVVGVWQAVIWSDGGGLLTNCGVDGVFGGGTSGATHSWQYYRMGSAVADGNVGPNTWSAANSTMTTSGSLVLRVGQFHTLYFTRNTSRGGGEYDYAWSWNNSSYNYTGYSTILITKSTTNCTY